MSELASILAASHRRLSSGHLIIVMCVGIGITSRYVGAPALADFARERKAGRPLAWAIRRPFAIIGQRLQLPYASDNIHKLGIGRM